MLCRVFTNTMCILLKILADNVIFIKQITFILLWSTSIVLFTISRRNVINQKENVAWGVEHCLLRWGCLFCESDEQDRLLAAVTFSCWKGVSRSSLPCNSVRIWSRDASLSAQAAQSSYFFWFFALGLENTICLVLLVAGPLVYIFFTIFGWNTLQKGEG